MAVQTYNKIISDLSINYIQFSNGDLILQLFILGKIANSVCSSDESRAYKQKIAKAVNNVCSGKYSPESVYAVSLSMRFCPFEHGNKKLDIENYLKPVLDGIAAGLFCNEDIDKIARFHYDDSNFLNLYVERLPDTMKRSEEGIVITISKKRKLSLEMP
jgi:hypothetical protein